MTTSYYFQTDEFALTEQGIQLLRSGYNYKTIRFSDVYKANIVNGKELDNWFVILMIGLVVLVSRDGK